MNTATSEIRCFVVDDEPLAASLICSYVERTPFLTLVGSANSAEEALDVMDREGIDLVFLDIRMPRLTGMQLAKLLPPKTKVVFTTAYSDHAVEGFRINALDYLLKPVSYNEFLQAAMRARAHFAQTDTAEPQHPKTQRSHILVKSEYKLIRIEIDNIVYIEGLKDYVKIYLESEKNPILSLMSIKSLERELSDCMMRVHRSFIVNINKVRVIEKNCIIFAGQVIPISESYKARFLQRLQS